MPPHDYAGHSHDHEHDEDDLGLSLRPQIDLEAVTCLNENIPNSARGILKLHEDRLSVRPTLRSPPDDPELLLTIPFTEAVSVRSVSVHSGGSNNADAASAPRRIKLFCDKDNLDFETAREMPALMELELVTPDHSPNATIDYPLRPAGRFQNISSITLFFQDNYDHDGEEDSSLPTEISYVGLKGKGSKVQRKAVDCVYESQGMREDHQTPAGEHGNTNTIS